jgi:hypothetical protein
MDFHAFGAALRVGLGCAAPEWRGRASRKYTPVTFAFFSAFFSWTSLTPMVSLSVDEALKVSAQGFPD